MNDEYGQPTDELISQFVLECFPEPVVVLDRSGNVLKLNRAARENRELDLAGTVGARSQEPGVGAFWDQLREHGQATLTLQRAQATGRVGHFVLEGRTVESQHVIMLRDETELCDLEDEVEQLRRVESLGLLTARVAHDLNNLLMPIMCLSHQLLAEVPKDSPAAMLALDIENAATKAEALVQDLLSFARSRPQPPEPVDVNAVVAGMRPLIRLLLEDRVELVLELSHDVGLVRVNRGQLEQCVLNLAANAKSAMPGGGRLEIRTAKTSVGRDGSSGAAPAHYVMLAVSDNGVGMTEEVRSRAFDPFFTTREASGGTGLGLSSVQRFARDSGGLIALESRVERGTTVTVYLPELDATADRR